MKTIIAALAATTTLTCFAASPPADKPEASAVFVYTTYFRCNSATIGNADEAVAKLHKPALNALIGDHKVGSWAWLVRNTGGEWTRAEYLTAPSAGAAVSGEEAFIKYIDRPKMEVDFLAACSSSENYIWHMLAGNDPRGPRGKVAFSTYYVCDQSRETQADALVKQVFAPKYDKLVADGKLTSWGWLEHIVGGKYRRLATLTAPTMDALLAAREGIVAAAEHDPLNDAFTSICGSHQDYIWGITDQGS
jgi:hypothetical protein